MSDRPTLDVWMRDPAAAIPDHIQALIFDMDGTLVDTMGAHYAAWKRALVGTGVSLAEERFYSLAGVPTRKIVEMLNAEGKVQLEAEPFAERKEKYFFEAMARVVEIKAVMDIARREQGRRKLAIASGGRHSVIQRMLRELGVEQLFPVISCADDVAHSKPAPDVFLEAARRLNVPPEVCVVYEDADLGFQGATAAGMVTVDVRPWYTPVRIP